MSKIITFKSIVKQEGEKDKHIKFTSKLKQTSYGEYQVFEFNDPSNKVMNRIEVSKKDVNIFAGQSSINLTLDEDIAIQYQTANGLLLLQSHLYSLSQKEDKIDFNYSLSYESKKIGDYHIFLEVTNEE